MPISPADRCTKPLPSTRYQGSKARFVHWIGEQLRDDSFESVLDLFGGTASVSYFMKGQGKRCIFNDVLASNAINGQALIKNGHVRLGDADVERILDRRPGKRYRETIARHFAGMFYLDDENRWLDQVAQNIPDLENEPKRALAYRALFQACLIKRPYNLFHRANLNMRTRAVKRTFGNKRTWETPFEAHFRRFVVEGNQAVFSNGRRHRVLCQDACDVDAKADLVYIDPPYLNQRGTGVDYLDFYHFLEGILCYRDWPRKLDTSRKHKPIRHEKPPWSDPGRIHAAFENVFERFADSILVVSYRNNGVPSVDELSSMLRRVKGHVRVVESDEQPYVLSTNRATREVLLIGER